MLVYRSDRCWRDKLSKWIGLHLHPPWSKHFCCSLILCLHWHRSNAYSLLQYEFGLMNRVLVELLSESPIARVYYRALFSCRLIFFSYFRMMLILIIRYVTAYILLHTLHKYIPVTQLPKRLGWHTKRWLTPPQNSGPFRPIRHFQVKSKLHLFLFYN